jgi:hypothetical protein
LSFNFLTLKGKKKQLNTETRNALGLTQLLQAKCPQIVFPFEEKITKSQKLETVQWATELITTGRNTFA